tara:strand:- start:417 stop:902 length:486 start_codon:yes stop_codon:yes gene_type:complete
MIKAIMAVDDKGGCSKNGTLPWPKNSNDLQWFKKNTLNHVVIMGKLTWIDPLMPSPLKKRINVLITNNKKDNPGADEYVSGNLITNINLISKKYKNFDKYIIGGPMILNQLFELIEEFYLTRIYGDYQCDKHIDLLKIEKKMKLTKKIKLDDKSHFEIWKK